MKNTADHMIRKSEAVEVGTRVVGSIAIMAWAGTALSGAFLIHPAICLMLRQSSGAPIQPTHDGCDRGPVQKDRDQHDETH